MSIHTPKEGELPHRYLCQFGVWSSGTAASEGPREAKIAPLAVLMYLREPLLFSKHWIKNIMAGGFKSRLWGVSASIVALIATSATSTTIDDGKLRTVNGISYYSGGTAVSKIVTSADFNTTQFQADIVPITIIRTNDAVFTKHALKDTISNYSASDDVFQTGFLECELNQSF